MRIGWEREENESEARVKAEEYCLKEGEWVELIYEYELREMVREIFSDERLSDEIEKEKEAAVRRWVSRNWEDFLPKGDPKEEFDYEENRT